MYSIFHTSHCGSTYLATLLSKSIPTLTEPDWSHLINTKKNEIEFVEKNTVKKELIKYSSVYCYMMPCIKGKKIFIYRKLSKHIPKINNSGYTNIQLNFHLGAMEKNFNVKTKTINYFNNSYLMHCALWADRFFWAMESKNTMFIDCEDLFKNTEYITKQACEFLNIEYYKIDINFNVKNIGLNRNNNYLNIEKIPALNFKEKYIEPYVEYDFNSLKYINQISKKFPELSMFI